MAGGVSITTVLIALGVVSLFGIITFALVAATLGTVNKRYDALQQQIADLERKLPTTATTTAQTTTIPTTTTTIPTTTTTTIPTTTTTKNAIESAIPDSATTQTPPYVQTSAPLTDLPTTPS